MPNEPRNAATGTRSAENYPETVPNPISLVFLSAIDFVRTRLAPIEKDFRTAYQHVTWVKDEVREVLEARDEENRIEEIGDVIMMSFRLSCFLHPEKTSEDILHGYCEHPTFRRYAREIGFEGAKKMRAKFLGRYSFLSDDRAFEELFEDGKGQRLWQREVVRRSFAAEKSREKGKSPVISAPDELPVSEAAASVLRELGWEAGRPEKETRTAGWFVDRFPDILDDVGIRRVFESFRASERFADERFFRMAYLDFASTNDARGAITRIAVLVGKEGEREAAIRMSLPEADDAFVANFLADGKFSDRTDRLHYRESFAAYRLFSDIGFSREEALEHADGLVATWWTFREIDAGYDLLEALREAASDPRLAQAGSIDEKYVIAFSSIHRYRKRVGSYDKTREFERKFLDSMRPYAR